MPRSPNYWHVVLGKDRLPNPATLWLGHGEHSSFGPGWESFDPSDCGISSAHSVCSWPVLWWQCICISTILHWFYIDSTSSKRFTPLACPQLPPRVQDGWHTILAGVDLDVLPSAMATKLFFSCLILSRVAKQTISGKRGGGIWKLLETQYICHTYILINLLKSFCRSQSWYCEVAMFWPTQHGTPVKWLPLEKSLASGPGPQWWALEPPCHCRTLGKTPIRSITTKTRMNSQRISKRQKLSHMSKHDQKCVSLTASLFSLFTLSCEVSRTFCQHMRPHLGGVAVEVETCLAAISMDQNIKNVPKNGKQRKHEASNASWIRKCCAPNKTRGNQYHDDQDGLMIGWQDHGAPCGAATRRQDSAI